MFVSLSHVCGLSVDNVENCITKVSNLASQAKGIVSDWVATRFSLLLP